jgi:hypothetical protein
MVFLSPRRKGKIWVVSQLVIMAVLFILLQNLLGVFARADHTYGNVRWYFDVGAATHEKGFFNVWTPYPPVFPSLLYLLSAFQKEVAGFINFYKILNLIGLALIAHLVFRVLEKEGMERALPAALGFALINATWASRMTIGLYMDQFDYLPILIMLASLYLLMKNRFTLSAVFCAVGFMTKMFPGAVLLIALFALGKKQRIAYIVTFAVVCAAILIPYLIRGTEPLVSWYNFTASRDGWETIWHYPKVKFPPIPNPKLLVEPFRSDARPYAWLTWLSALSMLGYMVWQRMGRMRIRASFPQQALCLLLLLLIFSKGVSSYFVFWLFPLLFVCYRPLLAFILCGVFILVANIEFFVDTHWLSIWLRHGLFIGLLLGQLIMQYRPRLHRAGDHAAPPPRPGQPGERDQRFHPPA